MAKRITRRGRPSRKNKSRKKRIVRKGMNGGEKDRGSRSVKKAWRDEKKRDMLQKRAEDTAKSISKEREIDAIFNRMEQLKLSGKELPNSLSDRMKELNVSPASNPEDEDSSSSEEEED